ncbi:pilus assembly FimT family protein [Brevundimonas variabilis]|uniref:pilus assembly FimT family protein n=1 Tax=Brevundimonas variabilis TaxID=74312 RepID=UPI00248455A4|nr:type II secretion system protein [Brevundimonas variabilis]
MSTPIRRARPDHRAGFSLMEILVVLVIFALSTAVIMPSMSRMLDQATAHAVFFDFQKQVSDLRREANRTGEPLRILDPAAAEALPQPAGEELPDRDLDRVLELRDPWTYTMAPALEIAEGGVCSITSANLVHQDRVVMTLRTLTDDCRFIRSVTGAVPPRAPASR